VCVWLIKESMMIERRVNGLAIRDVQMIDYLDL
jgi:hypothetical protein